MRPTCANLDEAEDDDDAKGEQLGDGEQVLDLGGRLHAETVDERQSGCKRAAAQSTRQRSRMNYRMLR